MSEATKLAELGDNLATAQAMRRQHCLVGFRALRTKHLMDENLKFYESNFFVNKDTVFLPGWLRPKPEVKAARRRAPLLDRGAARHPGFLAHTALL